MKDLIVKDVVIARSGLYEYSRKELARLGLKDIPRVYDGIDVFKVYRPASVLMAAHDKFTKLPITREHVAWINPQNYRDHVIGWTGDSSTMLMSDDKSEVIIKSSANVADAEGIAAYDSGIREVSPGYSGHFVWKEGSYQGRDYQIVMDSISEVNHLALTVQGRGGPDVKIADSGCTDAFKEEDHPRAENGEFGQGNGAAGGKKKDEEKNGEEKNEFEKPIATIHGAFNAPQAAIHAKESDFFPEESVKKYKSRFEEGKKICDENKGKSENQIWNEMDDDRLQIYTNLSDISEAFFLAGLRGDDPPKFTTAWRFGKAPDSGKSTNFAENRPERGVSMMGTREKPKLQGMYELFTKNNDPYFYAGYELPTKGTDGESLLVGCKEIPKDSGGEVNDARCVMTLKEKAKKFASGLWHAAKKLATGVTDSDLGAFRAKVEDLVGNRTKLDDAGIKTAVDELKGFLGDLPESEDKGTLERVLEDFGVGLKDQDDATAAQAGKMVADLFEKLDGDAMADVSGKEEPPAQDGAPDPDKPKDDPASPAGGSGADPETPKTPTDKKPEDGAPDPHAEPDGDEPLTADEIKALRALLTKGAAPDGKVGDSSDPGEGAPSGDQGPDDGKVEDSAGAFKTSVGTTQAGKGLKEFLESKWIQKGGK